MKGDLDINNLKVTSKKMKHKSQVTIFIIIAILVIAIVVAIFMISPKFKKAEEISESGKIYCKSEQRNADVCIQLYEPVCGFDENENPIKTFSNPCFACIDENIEYYIDGECK